MVDTRLFYINGKWTPPATPHLLDVENPATEKVIAQISLGSQADVDRAVAAARAAFESFSQTTPEERIALLERIVAEYNRRAPDLASAVTAEMGAPAWLARDAHVPLGAAHFTQAIEALKTYQFERQFGTIARAPRTGRRVRADHALELAAVPDRLQGRRRARGGLHDGAEAQ